MSKIKELEKEIEKLEEEGHAKFYLAAEKEDKILEFRLEQFRESNLLSKINFGIKYIEGRGGEVQGWETGGNFQLDSIYDETLSKITDEIYDIFPCFGHISIEMFTGVRFFQSDGDVTLSFDSPVIGLNFLKTHKIKISTKDLELIAKQADDKAKIYRTVISMFSK